MKLTGKYLADIHSSFVEFEVDELPTDEIQTDIHDKQSCYEAIWMGSSKKAGGGFGENSFSLMIGFDDSTCGDLELLKMAMSDDDVEEIGTIAEKYQ